MVLDKWIRPNVLCLQDGLKGEAIPFHKEKIFNSSLLNAHLQCVGQGSKMPTPSFLPAGWQDWVWALITWGHTLQLTHPGEVGG